MPASIPMLAQVSRVMDCAITVSGEGEERKYYLMCTNVKEGATGRQDREQDETSRPATNNTSSVIYWSS